MLKYLLPLIPEHRIYNEPFFGGGAMFFAKESVKVEFINDRNKVLIAFYKVLKNRFLELKKMLDDTLYSEAEHRRAREIYTSPDDYSEIEQAWAIFVLSQQSIFANFNNGWYSGMRCSPGIWNNKKQLLCQYYQERLRHVAIFCREALKVIRSTDRPDTFHFLDPPYIGSDMGPYKGYTEEDFINLLDTISAIKGKFLLTTFPHKILDEYIKKNKWVTFKIKLNTPSRRGGLMKIEQITANYDIRILLSQIDDITDKEIPSK